MVYLKLQVSPEDALPLSLCYNCASTLLSWYEIVTNCLDAEQRLLEIHQNVTTNKAIIDILILYMKRPITIAFSLSGIVRVG